MFVCIFADAAAGDAGLCVAAVVAAALGHVKDFSSSACAACGTLRAKIEDLDLTAAGDENIGGLNITVNDALCVRRIKAICDLNAEIEQAVEVEAFSFYEVLERVALQELHRDERVSVGLVDVVDGAYVWVVERGDGVRFSPETLEGLTVAAWQFLG